MLLAVRSLFVAVWLMVRVTWNPLRREIVKIWTQDIYVFVVVKNKSMAKMRNLNLYRNLRTLNIWEPAHSNKMRQRAFILGWKTME